ncbi:MAG: YqcC family protein [Pseudomonadales bacterium]
MPPDEGGSHWQLRELLFDLEAELRILQLWSDKTPSAVALASTQPFCYDTLTLPEWLQFVFLPRLKTLLDKGGELPSACGIAPMAEEYFSGESRNIGAVLDTLLCIDKYIAAHH